LPAQITHEPATAILGKATGFIKAFDYTLNPYNGCTFGCSYCYAAFFTPTQAQQDEWGKWVRVKSNALELLKKKRSRPLIDKAVYMSSVTDPYQPIERQLELTRAILQELLDYHQVRLVIQTRSPLVTRDLDLLQRFDSFGGLRHQARVNMTITTDDDDVRKAFEPFCASTAQRLKAIQTVHEAGVDACITLTPLLPVRDTTQFAHDLYATGVRHFVIQNFHETKSRFVAGTGEAARALLRERGWGDVEYERVKAEMGTILPNLMEGQEGFRPMPSRMAAEVNPTLL
jgi:DNA repair photolyase